MNVLNQSAPVVPVNAVTNIPAPQVITGTIAESQQPIPANPQCDMQSIIDSNLLGRVDFLSRCTLDGDSDNGTVLFSTHIPVLRGPYRPGSISNAAGNIINWAHFQLATGTYYQPVQHLGFCFIGPEAVIGKLLISYDPLDCYPGNNSSIPPVPRRDRRMITEEWDLSSSKVHFSSFMPHIIGHNMPTFNQDLPRSYGTEFENYENKGFIHPEIMTPAQFHSFGRVTLTVKQPIQYGSLFPRKYTIFVFTSLAGTTQSTPMDPRVANWSNNGDPLLYTSTNATHAYANP